MQTNKIDNRRGFKNRFIVIKYKDWYSFAFCKKEYHRQGIAKSLFNYALTFLETDKVTVNSSPYAVEAYHKLGFSDTDKEQELNGIRFTPMYYMK